MEYGGGGLHPSPGWSHSYQDAPPPGVPLPSHPYQGAAAATATPPGMGWPGGATAYPQWGGARFQQLPAWGVPLQQPQNLLGNQFQQPMHAFDGVGVRSTSAPCVDCSHGSFPSPIPATTSGGQNADSRAQEMMREPLGARFVFGRGGEGSAEKGNRNKGEKVKSAEKAARQAYDELLREEKHISVTKLCQRTLAALGVSSFELLGFRMQDVPCLRNFALVEGKVNAFILSHIAGKRITTLYDLGCAMTLEEGVMDFEELGLGPLLRHPVVVRYFDPPDEVLSITAEEVMQHLSDFIGEPTHRNNHVEIDGFMGYLQKERKAPTMQHLGVRIQSLGLHVGIVLRAKKGELESIKNWEALAHTQFELKTKSSVVSRVNDFLSSHKQTSKALDDSLKRKRDLINCSSDDERPNKRTLSEKSKPKMAMVKEMMEELGGSSRVACLTGPHRCPYPSAAEEKFRAKRQKKLQAELDIEQAFIEIERQKACQLSWTEVADFVMMLKDACSNQTVLQVLEHLLDNRPKNCVKIKRTKELMHFKTYPGIGLLYVAVMSVKLGLWDSMYDSLQEDTQQQQQQQKAAAQTVALVGPIDIECGLAPQIGLKKTEDTLDASCSKVERSSKSKQLGVSRVPLDRVLAFISQATFASKATEVSSTEYLERSVCEQFNVASIEDLGAGSLDSLIEQCKAGGKSAVVSTSVSFLRALVHVLRHVESSEEQKFSFDDISRAKGGTLGIKTTADAIQCLKNVPMLADLSKCSQWNAVFAPTLGPLLGWLEHEGSTRGIHALVTSTGAMLRVDGSPTVENFLPAAISGHWEPVALQLTSLVVAYGGVAHAPTALLKSYAAKALGVLLGSCTSGLPGERHISARACDVSMNTTGKPAQREKGQMSVTSTMALFLLKVLSAMPEELQVFAAEILLPAFSSVVPKSSSILMETCESVEHHLLLHGLGLHFGIHEWIDDFKAFVIEPLRCEDSTLGLRHLYKGFDKHGFLNFPVSHLSRAFDQSKISDQMHTWQAPGLKAPQVSLEENGEAELLAHKQSTELATGGSFERALVEEENRKNRSKESVTPISKQKAEEVARELLNRGVSTRPEEIPQVEGEDGLSDEAREVVEAIRRDEFGVGHDLDSREQDLLARQHARMGRALHRLSQDLYSQDSHFVLELVQNADDNSYRVGSEPALLFVVQHGHIVVLNNEEGFTPANIRALCDVGNSTKAGTSTGYIGHKGIGFKSVFRVTDSPEIHSNGFHVKFDTTESTLGFILPTSVSPRQDYSSYEGILSSMQKRMGLSEKDIRSWNTRIDLPIKASIREGPGMDSLAAKFDDIHPSLLLFLHRLRWIAIHNSFVGSTKVMYKEDLGNGLVRVTHDKGHATWLVVKHQVQAAVPRPGISTTEISLAFTLREVMDGHYEASPEQQQVFAFLPVRTYGLRFIVQGDFILPSSREEVDGDTAWNQWLLSEIPEAFMKAASLFKFLPALENPGRAVSNYMRFVPLEGEVLGFFSPLPRLIFARLQASPCLPVEGPEEGWSFPCAILRNWDDSARKLMPDSLLKEHLGLKYLNKDVELSDMVAMSLGIQNYGVRTLVTLMKALCQKEEGVSNMGMGWVRAWLIALHDCLLAEQQRSQHSSHQERQEHLTGDLQTLRFIPLANGSLTAITDGPAWFASQQMENNSGINKSLSCFPALYGELRTVHPILFQTTDENEGDVYSNEPRMANAGKIVSMLQQLGVRPMSAHQVFRSHVLPAMAESNFLSRETPILVQYLGYVKCHLESGCNQCTSDREDIIQHLKRDAVILTSNGPLRATQEAIHFGPTMGNSFDARGVLNGTLMKWNEVDVSYLQFPFPDPGSSSFEGWREFLHELGVTDFVQVLPVERVVKDKAMSFWKNESWERSDTADSGWVIQDWESPELLDLISAVCSLEKETGQIGNRALKRDERCSRLLLALDKLWANEYSSSWRAKYRLLEDKRDVDRGETTASWVLQVQNLKWVLSSLDKQLHTPTMLFQRCDAVSSVLGSHAPYSLPQIQSTELMTALGLRTQVTVDDGLFFLRHWGHSSQPFEASVAQMARLYLFLAERIQTHREEVLDLFTSQPAIFLPWKSGNAREEVLKGRFFALEDVCWNDPTGALTALLSITNMTSSSEVRPSVSLGTDKQGDIKSLSSFYPELQSFFVEDCQVQGRPNFYGYVSIIQSLAAMRSPSSVLNQVMEILAVWSWDVECGRVTKTEVQQWKSRLQEADCRVLPTTQDRWVSLHSHFGLVCVCDDKKLGEEFPDSLDGVHFLQLHGAHFCESMPKISQDKPTRRDIEPLYTALGIPLLSQVVKREVILYGSQDPGPIEALLTWALPYAQRFVRQHHRELYDSLEKEGIAGEVQKLRCVVVDQLYFRYSLQSGRHFSRRRIGCGCVLEGCTLHIAAARAEDHCMVFAELSRLLFLGQPNQQFANFLHLITLMASLGSSETDVESYIVDTQGVQPLPLEVGPWILDTSIKESSPVNLGSSAETAPFLADLYLQRHAKLEESISRKAKPMQQYSGWPPRSWVPLPTVKSTAMTSVNVEDRLGFSEAGSFRDQDTAESPQQGTQAANVSERMSAGLESNPSHKHVTDLAKSDGALSFFSLQDSTFGTPKMAPTHEVVLSNMDAVHKAGGETSGAWAREQLVLGPPNEQQREMTGRAGEEVAYHYLTKKYGATRVKWVNEDGETGAAFDIIVTTESGQQEFVEVKTTRSLHKDWFEISTQEWEFAQVQGDLFSVLRIVLSGSEHSVQILHLPNLVKLCHERVLQLAVLLPSNNSQGNSTEVMRVL